MRVANDALHNESHAVWKIANNADADRGFLSKNRGASHCTKKQEVLKNMITGIKKTHKTTEIYFDEADEWTTVITYNTSLKNRFLAFSQEYPELCKIVSDDECGCLQFKIQKRYFTYRISAPYSEERKEKARTRCRNSMLINSGVTA